MRFESAPPGCTQTGVAPNRCVFHKIFSSPSGNIRFLVAESLGEVLPGELLQDVKKNVRGVVQGSLDKMNLVTREELNVQQKVLARTREQLEVLQQRVSELEKALQDTADP